MPRFSILISAYNAEKYIGYCLESIQKQEFIDYEIILVDDGSTDKTYTICKQYAAIDDRINLFHWENHGLILARRKGVSMARGEYVLFLDADDYYLDHSLKKLNDALICHENPDILLFRFQFIYEGGQIKDSRDIGVKQYYLCDDVVERQSLMIDTASNYEYNHLWSKAIRRELLLCDKCDYNEFAGVQLGEDLLQTVPLMAMANHVTVVSEVLYGYRVLQTSMAHFFKKKQIEDINRVYEHILLETLPKDHSWQNVEKAFYDAYMTKICSLMRTLWESDMKYEDKILVSQDILSFQLMNREDMKDTRMPIQNKVFRVLAKKKMWGFLRVYSGIIKTI